MTYKEVHSLLKNFDGKKSRLKSMLSFITERRTLIEGVGAVNYDNVSVVSSPGNSTEERYIKELDRLKDLQQRYDLLYDDLCQDEERIFNLMRRLSPTEYEVILNRFLRGLSCTNTARVMSYSIDGIKDAQTRAIKKMSKI